jgi:light-regulated signal transduction histidine kinase (bacteriophytochrome)
MLLFAESIDHSIVEMVREKVYLLDGILYWLLFSSVTFLLVHSIGNLIEQVKKDNRIIEDQREELAAMNEELTQSNENLIELNNKMSLWNDSLEETVAKRTSEIERQNIQLKEYAYYNAHKLRGPFCRIKGLLNLSDITHDAREKLYIQSLFAKTLDEFEEVVQEIQGIVNESPN